MPLVITAAAKAKPTVTHTQLRHLLSCPQRRGIVYYVSDCAILERDLLRPTTRPRTLVNLDFDPTCFATALVPSDPDLLLLAVGGTNSQLHLSLHSLKHPATASPHTRPKPIWFRLKHLRPKHDVVNYMFFSPAELTDDTRAPRRKTSASSSPTDRAPPDPAPSDLRLVVCGNDMAVHFFDIDLRTPPLDHQRLRECGVVRLDTCVNHASISPDGRTLLCVGDTPHAYLFRIIPGASVTCEPLATYTFPMLPYEDPNHLMVCNDPPSYVSLRTRTYRPTIHTYSTIHGSMPPRACFATAWTSDGLKFAVGSQEGALAVWDVRSSLPIWVFWSGLRAPSAQQRRERRRARAASAGWWGANEWTSDGESSWDDANSAAGEPAPDASDAAPAAAGANPGDPPGQPPPRLPRLGALSFPPEGNTGSSAASSPTVRVPTTRHMFPPVTLPMPAVVSEPEPEPEALMSTWADGGGVFMTPSDFDVNGPDNAIRNLQFSTGDAGRELCVFVEHTTNIHVIDARTFDPSTHRMFAFPDVDEMVAAHHAERAADPSAAAAACPHAEAAPVPEADAAAPSADAAAAAPENAGELGASPASPAEVQMESADDEASTVGTRNGTPEPHRRGSVAEAYQGLRWGEMVDRVYPLIPDVPDVQTSPEREEGEEQEIAGVMRPVTPEADVMPEAHDATGEMESVTASAAMGGVQETEAGAELAQLIARRDTPSVDAREATPEPDGPVEMHPSDGMSMLADATRRAGAGTPPLNVDLIDPQEFSQWIDFVTDTNAAPAASQDAPGSHARDVPTVTRADGSTHRVHSNSPTGAIPPRTIPGPSPHMLYANLRPTTPSRATPPSRAQAVAPPQGPHMLQPVIPFPIHGGTRSVPAERGASQSPAPVPRVALPSTTTAPAHTSGQGAAPLRRERRIEEIAAHLAAGQRGRIVDALARATEADIAAETALRGAIDSQDPRDRDRIAEGLAAEFRRARSEQRQRRHAGEAGRESDGSQATAGLDGWGQGGHSELGRPNDWGASEPGMESDSREAGNRNSWSEPGRESDSREAGNSNDWQEHPGWSRGSPPSTNSVGGWGETTVNSVGWPQAVSFDDRGTREGGNSHSNRSESRLRSYDPWGNPTPSRARRPSDPRARSHLTEEGVIEYLDADGDPIPREDAGAGPGPGPLTLVPMALPRRRVGGTAPDRSAADPRSVIRITGRRREIHHVNSWPPSPFPVAVEPPAPQPPSVVMSREPSPPRGPRAPQIAGLCFDPTGEWVYVAGDGGIVEWRVRERFDGKGCGGGGWL